MNYMQCRHPAWQWRLVSWAIDSSRGHEQGFFYRKQCVVCGCVVGGNQ